MNKRYLFLLAWVDGSDGASGDATKIHAQSDLEPQYQSGNEYVFAVEIETNLGEDIAYALGIEKAFHNNYTAYDTVSVCVEIDDSYSHPDQELYPRVHIVFYVEKSLIAH